MKSTYFLLSCIITFLLSSISRATPFDFASPEHVLIGDSLILRFDVTEPGKTKQALTLPNGVQLTYGQILALGDFYGTPNEPISPAKSEDEMKERFMAAFNSFALNPAVKPELNQLLAIFAQQQSDLDAGALNGETEEQVYTQMGLKYDIQINCITGGGCYSADFLLFPGRSLALALTNYDHFGQHAIEAYQVGHALALETALLAHQTRSKQTLEQAYAMNALACHFLSDRFAAGHLRSPREVLPEHVTPTIVGHLLVNMMHNEENEFGLHVHNARGDQWVAFGDHIFMSTANQRSAALQLKALQHSVDEVFYTYINGEIMHDDAVNQLIPYPDEAGGVSGRDIAALFYWDEDNHELMRRIDLTHPYSNKWTASWSGWQTLLFLINKPNKPTDAPKSNEEAVLRLGDISAVAWH